MNSRGGEAGSALGMASGGGWIGRERKRDDVRKSGFFQLDKKRDVLFRTCIFEEVSLILHLSLTESGGGEKPSFLVISN